MSALSALLRAWRNNSSPNSLVTSRQFFISRIMSTTHVCGPVIKTPPHGSILLEMADDEVWVMMIQAVSMMQYRDGETDSVSERGI